MKALTYLIVSLLLSFSVYGEDFEFSKIPDDKSASIATVEKLGQLIYKYDQYAAFATDIMLENLPNPEEKGIQGWIVTIQKKHAEVLFVKENKDNLTSPCQVIFNANKKPMLALKERLLTKPETEMYKARQHTSEIIEQRCSEIYNTVVMPSPDKKTWVLYALASTTDPQVIVAGGHYRADISLDGTKILTKRGFTKTCLQISQPSLPEGAEPTAFYLTHLLDDTPTEVHVFLSLLYRTPCVVGTKDGNRWLVKDGTIKLLKI